jgi:hypothetical protein
MHESDSTLRVKEKALEPHKGGGGCKKKTYMESVVTISRRFLWRSLGNCIF